MSVFDWIVIVIFVSTVLICSLRGFVKSISGIARFVGAFLFAKCFSPFFGAFLSETLIGPKVYAWLEERIAEMLGGIGETMDLGVLFEGAHTDFTALLDRFGALEHVDSLKETYGDASAATEETLSEMVRSFSAPWVDRFSTVIAAILIFIFSFILLWVLTKLLIALIDRIQVLNRTNRILGVLFGIVAGVCAVLAFCYVCSFFTSFLAFMGSSSDPVRDALDSSAVFGYIYRFFMGIS